MAGPSVLEKCSACCEAICDGSCVQERLALFIALVIYERARYVALATFHGPRFSLNKVSKRFAIQPTM